MWQHIRKRRILKALESAMPIEHETPSKKFKSNAYEIYETAERKLRILESWEIRKRSALDTLFEDVQYIANLHLRVKELSVELTRRGGEPEAVLAEHERQHNASKELPTPLSSSTPKPAAAQTQSTRTSVNNVSTSMPVKLQLAYDNSPDDFVIIGPNGTKVSKAALKAINWSLAGPAITRKILIEIFDRNTLAFHTLSGKPSPAFMDVVKPKKKPLNPAAVADIIHLMTENLDMTEKEVRNAITNKCADENKMFRHRQERQQKRLSNMRQSFQNTNED